MYIFIKLCTYMHSLYVHDKYIKLCTYMHSLYVHDKYIKCMYTHACVCMHVFVCVPACVHMCVCERERERERERALILDLLESLHQAVAVQTILASFDYCPYFVHTCI